MERARGIVVKTLTILAGFWLPAPPAPPPPVIWKTWNGSWTA